MGLIFVMTFSGIGAVLSDWMEAGVDAVKEGMDFLLTASDVNPVVHSLVIHGVADGVGSVISFLPTIVTLFSFCRFWKIPAIWHGWPLSWTGCCAALACRGEALCRC